MNGKAGDHPFTDIVTHGVAVYSDLADSLIRDVARLADERTTRELADRLIGVFNVHRNPDVAALERELVGMRDRLTRDARARGFEV